MSRNLRLLVVLIAVGTLAAYIIVVVIPTTLTKRAYAAARTLGEDFEKAFQFTPEVTIAHTVVLNQQTSIWEIAVLSQNFEHRYTWSNSWLGSTKKIMISGSFDAKVGFDLHEKFSIAVNEDRAIVTLPSPRLLSVESKGDIAYRDEQGIWNWVNLDDRTRATNAYIKDARGYAAQADFIADARTRMEERLRLFFTERQMEVEIRYPQLLQQPK